MQSWKIVVVACLIVLGCVAPALAQPEQTPAEMRTEIDLLRQRVAQLEAQLEAAVARHEQLAQENAALRKQLAERPEAVEEPARTATGASLEVPTDLRLELEVTPETWSASPDSLFNELRRDYDRVMKDIARESRSDQQRYYALVGKWVPEAERTHRDDVVWTVRVTRVLERPDRAGDVTVQVVNPETGRAWGDPFTMMLPRSFREQLEESPDRHYWELAGTLTATPNLNREREAPGFFLHPLFIGPFAEFEYEFRTRELKAVSLDEAAPPSDEGESASGDKGEPAAA